MVVDRCNTAPPSVWGSNLDIQLSIGRDCRCVVGYSSMGEYDDESRSDRSEESVYLTCYPTGHILNSPMPIF